MSHAQALGVLVRSIVVEREPIYRAQETVHGFAAGLFGVAADDLESLSDDRLGRALDRLFEADRAALLTEVVLAVAKRFAVQLERLHNDSTSISFCGQYHEQRGPSQSGQAGAGNHVRIFEGSPPGFEATAQGWLRLLGQKFLPG